MTLITSIGNAQHWQSFISVDSRVGYSTNTYLNPFLSEWNSTTASTYNFTSIILQSNWFKDGNNFSITGGFFFEPIFRQSESWRGGLGIVSFDHRFSNDLSAGVETGGSYFSSSYSRSLFWVQPKITWFISPFTLLRFKAGSNFRNYRDYIDSQSTTNWFDLYGLEFENWPTFRWKLTAGLYGSIDTLPSIQNGFNARAGAGYHFRNGASLSLNMDLEQYKTTSVEQVNGGPPVAGPPNRQTTISTVNTDRIIRLELNGSYPLNDRFSLFTTAAVLHFRSESSQLKDDNYKIAGGVRLSFEPKFRKGRGVVTPEWDKSKDKQQINIHYSGNGRLYLVGDFNNWNRTGVPLRKQSNNNYVAKLNLSPGAYEYKVLRIQGDSEEWLRFSNDTYTVSDGYGSQNAMLLIE
ncbi:MAG: glycogen-binding domain-containing protein [Balneolaceae bacterium]|jgi:hypothetical protein